jgi:transposase
MSVFEDAGHFASWAGLAPGCDESAGKRRSSRTARAGQYLKPVLVQCALASTTAKATAGDYFAAKYRRLRARRGHKRAVVAVARMMAVCIWHMLSSGEVFNPSVYMSTENCATNRLKSVPPAPTLQSPPSTIP